MKEWATQTKNREKRSRPTGSLQRDYKEVGLGSEYEEKETTPFRAQW